MASEKELFVVMAELAIVGAAKRCWKKRSLELSRLKRLNLSPECVQMDFKIAQELGRLGLKSLIHRRK